MLKTMSERLTEMKKDAGLTNRKLAELSGVPEGTVNSILSGNTQHPTFEDVSAIVTAMGRGIDEIFGEPQSPAEVQTAVIDHYAILIESYKNQIDHYKDQVDQMRKNYDSFRSTYKEQISNHRKGLWALLAVEIILVAVICYLCIDFAHDSWGLFQRSLMR